MATYRIFKPAGLFEKADFTSQRLGTVPLDTTFIGTPQGDGFIKASIPSVSPTEGFLLEDGHAEELVVAPIPVHPGDVGTFCALVTRAARDASTDRDYLLAVAYDQTKNLTEMADAAGKKVGPFRYSEEEWSAAIADPRLKDEMLQVQDRFLWYRQPIVAARAASDAVTKFKAAFDGRLPKFNELYFFQSGGDDALTALRSGSQATIDALAELQQRLQGAYAEALKVIDGQSPEIQLFRPTDKQPASMVVTPPAPGAQLSDGADSAIAWGAVVSREFKEKLINICKTLGCDPNNLMAAMAFETGERFTPDVKNPRSGATGLIQFMPDTAHGLGTSTAALAAMTAVDQLDFVLKYFLPQKGRMSTISDLYMAILFPVAVGKPEDTALFAKPSLAYEQNSGLDGNGDGIVTKAEATSLVAAKLQRGMKSGFKG